MNCLSIYLPGDVPSPTHHARETQIRPSQCWGAHTLPPSRSQTRVCPEGRLRSNRPHAQSAHARDSLAGSSATRCDDGDIKDSLRRVTAEGWGSAITPHISSLVRSSSWACTWKWRPADERLGFGIARIRRRGRNARARFDRARDRRKVNAAVAWLRTRADRCGAFDRDAATARS